MHKTLRQLFTTHSGHLSKQKGLPPAARRSSLLETGPQRNLSLPPSALQAGEEADPQQSQPSPALGQDLSHSASWFLRKPTEVSRTRENIPDSDRPSLPAPSVKQRNPRPIGLLFVTSGAGDLGGDGDMSFTKRKTFSSPQSSFLPCCLQKHQLNRGPNYQKRSSFSLCSCLWTRSYHSWQS